MPVQSSCGSTPGRSSPGPPAMWLMVSLCVVGGGLSLALGLDFLADGPGDAAGLRLVRWVWREVALFLVLPAAVAAGVLAARGRNRTGGWLLLAVPATVTIASLPGFGSLRFVAVGLGSLFLAAVLAGLSGPVRSWGLALVALLLWAAAAAGGLGPRYLEGRLERASRAGDLATVSRLLALGVHPEPGRGRRTTPLRLVVERGDVAMARLLLANGASPFRDDAAGVKPLTRCLELGHTEITVEMLKALDLVPRPGPRGID